MVMGKLIYLLTFISASDPMYQNAGDTLRRAILETPMAKSEMLQLQTVAEEQLYRFTGLTEQDLVYGAYFYPLVTGNISSKPFKNFKYETKNHYVFRPEIDYAFASNTYIVNLILIKSF